MELIESSLSDGRNVIYIILVAIVLVSNIAGRNNDVIGKIMRFTGLLAALGFVCAVIYFHLPELSNLRNLLAFQTKSFTITHPGKIIINANDDKQFFLNVKIDDQTVTFLVDPELSDIVLNHEDAKKIGIDLNELSLDKSYLDHGEKLWAASSRIKKVTIDDLTIKNLDVLVGDANIKISRLGANFIQRFETQKISDDKITLRGLMEAPGQVIVPAAGDGHFYFKLSMNNISIRCMVDTGATRIVLDPSHAKKLGFDESKLHFNEETQTANGISYAANVTLDEVAIGDIRFYNVAAILNQGDNAGLCLLGIDFLNRFKKYEVSKNKLVLDI